MPTLTRQLVMTIAVVLMAASQACFGQGTSSKAPSTSPGVWHEGRFLGFVPAHRRGHQPVEPPPVETTTQRRAVRPPTNAKPVVPVAFESRVRDEPVSVPMPDESIDLGIAGSVCERSCCLPCSFWGRAEYLYWWTRGMETPPLATSSGPGTPQAQAGVLGQSTTAIVFGDDGMNTRGRSGGRFTLGYWCDPAECNGIEVTYLLLGTESTAFHGSVFDYGILARPFFNVQSGAEDARLIVFPGVVDGVLDIQATTAFQSFEALYRHSAYRTPCSRLDYLVGYRYSELEDRLRIDERTESLSGPTAGTTFELFDQFDSRNTFNGVELGIILQCEANECWTWESVFKIALGATRSRADVAGRTVTTTGAGASTTSAGGLLALPTNIGSFSQENFAAIAEAGLTLRRDFRCGLSATVGYSFVYWSDVARAGDQVDRAVNPTQIPPGTLVGSARPAFSFIETDFWAQGLRFGLEYAY